MCVRYSLTVDLGDLAKRLEFDGDWLASEAKYSLALIQEVLTVMGGGESGGYMRWGLIPHWPKDPKIGARMIIARAEKVAEKPMFRDELRHRRCLVLADGFYG